jgi:transposase
MIRILDKGIILRLIVPHLSVAKRGFTCRTSLANVVNAILYKFRTGCQWKLLPVSSLIPGNKIKYGAIYHHFRKWAKDGSWKRVRKALIRYNPAVLDLSLAHFDGTHSRAMRGGKGIGYQRRKRSMTNNTLWLTDRSGLVVSYIPPMSGNHNDLYKIEQGFNYLVKDLSETGIKVDGLFVNADAGFDSKAFRALCEAHGIHLNAPVNSRRGSVDEFDLPYFDDLMYKERFVVERTNAWMDAHRSLLVRFDTTMASWTAWHDIYSMLIWTRKISKV